MSISSCLKTFDKKNYEFFQESIAKIDLGHPMYIHRQSWWKSRWLFGLKHELCLRWIRNSRTYRVFLPGENDNIMG